MFSNITDAWTNDPVKDITNKLSNGAFLNHNEHENIFNFKKQNFSENKKNINLNEPAGLSEKLAAGSTRFSEFTNSDNLSLSLLSDNTDVVDYSDAKPIKNYLDKSKKNKVIRQKKEPVAYNFTDTDTSNIFDSIEANNPEIKNQDRYYYQKIKKLVDDKINKKLDDFMLENKLKQIENFSQTEKKCDNSWRDMVYIIIAVVIVILIIVLVFKCLH